MKKQRARQLAIRSQTIRVIATGSLDAVAGGIATKGSHVSACIPTCSGCPIITG